MSSLVFADSSTSVTFDYDDGNDVDGNTIALNKGTIIKVIDLSFRNNGSNDIRSVEVSSLETVDVTSLETVDVTSLETVDVTTVSVTEFADSGIFFSNYIFIGDDDPNQIPVPDSPFQYIKVEEDNQIRVVYDVDDDGIGAGGDGIGDDVEDDVEDVVIVKNIEFPIDNKWVRVGNPLVITNCESYEYTNETGDLVNFHDKDNDGICDEWEDGGTDTGLALNVFIPGHEEYAYTYPCTTFCAGSDKRDVFLEIDYIRGHFPNLEALEMIVHSFYDNIRVDGTIDDPYIFLSDQPVPDQPVPDQPVPDQPVRLHIQIDEMVADFEDETSFPGEPWDRYLDYDKYPNLKSVLSPGFDQIKGAKFGSIAERMEYGETLWNDVRKNKQLVFHYALFAHKIAGDVSRSSAVSEFKGNDIMMTPGWLTGGVGSKGQQAGTLMHELGHNLGLSHGGDDDINCKPNYFSVMSYNRQWIDEPTDIKLDYSSDKLDYSSDGVYTIIKEGEQNESDIFPSYQDSNQTILYSCPTVNPELGVLGTGVLGNTVDWDCDGNFDDYPGSNNINNLPECSDYKSNSGDSEQKLKGHNDWNNLTFNFKEHGEYAADGRQVVGTENLQYKELSPSLEINNQDIFMGIKEPNLESLTLQRIDNLLKLSYIINSLGDNFSVTQKSTKSIQDLNDVTIKNRIIVPTIDDFKQSLKKEEKLSSNFIYPRDNEILRAINLRVLDNIIDDINHQDLEGAQTKLNLLNSELRKSLPPNQYKQLRPTIENILISYNKSLDFKPTELFTEHTPEKLPIVEEDFISKWRNNVIKIECKANEVRIGNLCVDHSIPKPIETPELNIPIWIKNNTRVVD